MNPASVGDLIGEEAQQRRLRRSNREKHHSSFSIRVVYIRTKLKN